MPVQTWTPGQVLTAAEMKTVTDILPYWSGVAASVNPAVAGTFYGVDATGGARTITITSVTAGQAFGIAKVDSGTNVVTITLSSGHFRGKGIDGATSTTLGAQHAFIVLMSDGTDYHVIGGETDSGWITASNQNSWTGAVGYRLIGNRVTLRGSVTGGSTNTVFTIPVGFRPLQNVNSGNYNAGAGGWVAVSNAGLVQVISTTGVQSVDCSFLVD